MSNRPKPCKSPFKVKGITLNCSECQEEMPLLHPHIIIERSDDDGNLLCESCWREIEKRKRQEAQ